VEVLFTRMNARIGIAWVEAGILIGDPTSQGEPITSLRRSSRNGSFVVLGVPSMRGRLAPRASTAWSRSWRRRGRSYAVISRRRTPLARASRRLPVASTWQGRASINCSGEDRST